MKKAVSQFFGRLGQLVLKLVSVKGVLAGVAWAAFAKDPSSEWSFWLVVIFSGLFVVGREWNKYLEVLKIIKK